MKRWLIAGAIIAVLTWGAVDALDALFASVGSHQAKMTDSMAQIAKK